MQTPSTVFTKIQYPNETPRTLRHAQQMLDDAVLDLEFKEQSAHDASDAYAERVFHVAASDLRAAYRYISVCLDRQHD